MNNRLPLYGGIAFVVLVIIWNAIFIVDQREFALVRQFGAVQQIITKPGLQFKIPFVQDVILFDNRILTIYSNKDVTSDEQIMTKDKQAVIVDYYIKWQITQPLKFYRLARNEEGAMIRLSQAVEAGLREEFGKNSVQEAISVNRDAIMQAMRKRADRDASLFGAKIIDVRLKRVNFPQEVAKNVHERMSAERQRVAKEYRSTGLADAEAIRAGADREHDIIVAEATRQAQEIKGEGDAKAAAIYAEAYGQDAEFYAFWRSLEAYRASFANKNDVMVIAPDSDFYKYLKAPNRR